MSALPAIVNRSSAENTAFCNLSVAANYLLADAALDGLRPKLAEFIDSVRGADLVERLASLVRALHALTVTYEAELCTMMRLALEAALDPRRKDAGWVRSRRRVDWIDSFLVLRDIRGLPERRIEDVVLWICRTLLAQSLPREQGLQARMRC